MPPFRHLMLNIAVVGKNSKTVLRDTSSASIDKVTATHKYNKYNININLHEIKKPTNIPRLICLSDIFCVYEGAEPH